MHTYEELKPESSRINFDNIEYYIWHRKPKKIPDELKDGLDPSDIRLLEEISYEENKIRFKERDETYYEIIYNMAVELKSEDAVMWALKFFQTPIQTIGTGVFTDYYIMLVTKKLTKHENIKKAIERNTGTKFLMKYINGENSVSREDLMNFYNSTPEYERSGLLNIIYNILGLSETREGKTTDGK